MSEAIVGHVFYEFLPPTQTFIANLISAHDRYRPTILTRSLVDPGAFPRERIVELSAADPSTATRIGRRALRRMGRWQGVHDRELERAGSGCDVLHAHFGPTGSRSALAASRLGVPLITTFYGWDLALPGSRDGARADYQRLFRRGTAFVCEGPAMSEHLVALGCPRERIRIAPIPIEPAKFPFRPREPSSALKLIQTGRLIPKKGFDVSLRAFAAAGGQERGWELWIVGDGPERRPLELLAESLGVGASVQFLGGVSHERYRELLGSAQIGLQPSRTAPDGDTEGGAPTVLLEMQASGMPVLASRHADIPSVVGDQRCLVAEEDHQALADLLVRTAEASREEWHRAAELSRRQVLERHSAARVAAVVEGIYDEAREASPAARHAGAASRLRRLAGRGRRAARSRLARINEEPVFVLGQVKSGTTAIAALLAERSGSTVTLDVPALFGSGFMPILTGETTLMDVARANRVDFSRDIIKQASLTWIYPQAREAFPKARFVMIVRDPRDNVRSILNRLGLPGDQDQLTAAQLASLPDAWRWHLEIPDELDVGAASYVELLAAGWQAAADIYLGNPSGMRLVRYEDFLADKAGSVSECATDVGLPLVNDITHLVDVQHQPRGDREISWEAFFGERNLRAIEARCAEPMARLGYEASGPGSDPA